MPEPVKIDVAFPLNLDTEMTGRYRQVTEDDYTRTEVTLLDLIVEEAARQLVAAASADTRRDVRRMVHDRTIEMIDARIVPMLDEAFAAPVQRTNEYGEPTGKPTTLRELVIAEAQRTMGRRTDRYGDKPSLLDAALKEVTYKVVQADLKAEVDALKATIRGRFQEVAGQVVADAVAKATGAA